MRQLCTVEGVHDRSRHGESSCALARPGGKTMREARYLIARSAEAESNHIAKCMSADYPCGGTLNVDPPRDPTRIQDAAFENECQNKAPVKAPAGHRSGRLIFAGQVGLLHMCFCEQGDEVALPAGENQSLPGARRS